MQIIRPSEWITQPWRNGGGVTREVFREGPADAFTLRISIADIERAGPFSRFAGVDRWITLLSGPGFALRRGEVVRVVDTPLVPFRFSGDDDVDCGLVEGPVRDLNVMAARDALKVDVSSIGVFETMKLEPPAWATRVLLFALVGPALVDELRLENHELLVDDARARTLVGPCDVLVVWSGPASTQTSGAT